MVRKFHSLAFRLSDISCILANICIFVNMMVVVVHVVGRVFFNSPIFGLVDIVAFSFGLSCAFAFCYAEKHNNHVKLDFLMGKLPPPGKKILHIFLSVLYLGFIGLIAVLFFRYAAATFRNQTVTMTIRLSYYPVVFLTAVGLALYFLTALANCLSFFEAPVEKTGKGDAA